MKKVLIVTDLVGAGKVTMSEIIPILTKMGCAVDNLPTVLVSNTFHLGRFEVNDLTEYMRKTLTVWEELNFKFQCIYTGYLNSDEQFKILKEFITNSAEKKSLIVIDPVMADNGSIYPGLSLNIVENMRKFIGLAHLITPNLTEAAYLLGKDTKNLHLTEKEVKEWLNGLRDLGSKSVIITSVKLVKDDKYNYIFGYDYNLNNFFKVKYEHIKPDFPGTGDIFTSVVIGEMLKGNTLENASIKAANFIEIAIKESLNKECRKEEGLILENVLNELN